jgi:hypothetical protein
MTFKRRPLEVVEIVQPLCSRTFGVGVCEAVGVPCYNTDATCKFRAALDMTDSLSLKFVTPHANKWIEEPFPPTTEVGAIFQPALALSALTGYGSVPTSLNVAGGSQNKSPLGYRAVANIAIKDFPWNDVDTDPYRADRTYDPETRGSFWTKWLVRNPFHLGYTLRRYEGVEGNSLSDMIMREYVIERIDHGRSGVFITAKDVLRRITANNVTAPALSTGVLSADINNSVTTVTAAGASIDDYPASGWIRIGDEIMSYTARATVSTNVQFTGVIRGRLGSTADSHSEFDIVQTVLAYEDVPFNEIIYDLLVTYGGINPAFITQADWESEFDVWRPTFRFTAYISEPEQIDELVGEICLQAQANVWWDERIQKIILRAQRPDFAGELLTDSDHIVAGSYSVKEKPEERVSQVWTYYNIRNWADDPQDTSKYSRVSVRIDVDKQIQYGGEVAIRSIAARWIPTEIIATNLSLGYLQRFKDVRREITFELSAKDGTSYWTGNGVSIQHFLDVDIHGAPKIANWLITSAEAVVPNGRYKFVAEDNGTSGVLWEWVDEAEVPAFVDATVSDKLTIGYWLDDDGNDADGAPRSFRWL